MGFAGRRLLKHIPAASLYVKGIAHIALGGDDSQVVSFSLQLNTTVGCEFVCVSFCNCHNPKISITPTSTTHTHTHAHTRVVAIGGGISDR